METNPHSDYPCPLCKALIEILPTTGPEFKCPWCGEDLRRDTELDKLVSRRSHWDDDV